MDDSIDLPPGPIATAEVVDLMEPEFVKCYTICDNFIIYI